MKLHLDFNAGGQTQFSDEERALIESKLLDYSREDLIEYYSNAESYVLNDKSEREFEDWLSEKIGDWAISHFDSVTSYYFTEESDDE